MINPKDVKYIRLSDIKACPTSGIFFNVLFNLNKFIAFEQRDPFQAHAEKQGAEKTYTQNSLFIVSSDILCHSILGQASCMLIRLQLGPSSRRTRLKWPSKFVVHACVLTLTFRLSK